MINNLMNWLNSDPMIVTFAIVGVTLYFLPEIKALIKELKNSKWFVGERA